jgi:hypothetical protein
MAYDAAHAQVVLFGGHNRQEPAIYGDTWMWDGSDWTKRAPVHSPFAREAHTMAYDAGHGQMVLFGGYVGNYLGDTWTWDGNDWAVPFRTSGTLRPRSGPPGTIVEIHGWGYGGYEKLQLTFIDAVNGTRKLDVVTTDGTGAFVAHVTIPASATPGEQTIKVKGRGSGQFKRKTFTVT